VVLATLTDFPGEAELLSVMFEEEAAHNYRQAREARDRRPEGEVVLELGETDKDLIDHYEEEDTYECSDS
jgi:hypothetical protein